jgi:release factor glutamine methyltransferase
MPLVSDTIAHAAERLARGPHPEWARADAELLLARALGRNRTWLLAHPEATISDGQARQYAEWLERRSGGEPVQYILAESEFYGMPFRVTRDVLIPRPETEHVVEKAIELAVQFAGPRIVDVGTGSGAIAVALACRLPEGAITAIDSCGAALGIARWNAERLGFEGQIRFLKGDLLAPVAGEQFDLIVSNPPYVAERDRETLAAEVREFEPAQALFAGEDGLAVYRRLVPAAHARLAKGGWIVLEIGFGQEARVRELLRAAGFEEIDFAADLQGIPRVASARSG